MLKNRLIAVLLLVGKTVVQSVQFKHTNVIHSDAIHAIDFFDKWSVDEIILLDVSRSKDNRLIFLDTLERISKKCFVPLSVGGWIEDLNDVNQVISLGAEKVIMNTKVINNPKLISDTSNKYGNQCVVISIDVKKIGNEYIIHTDRGKKPSNLNLLKWIEKIQALGCGEIFINCINNDGMRKGYDLNLLKSIRPKVNVPIIAMGGVLNWNHLVAGIKEGYADAVAYANLLHYTELSALKAKKYMLREKINVR